MSRKIERHLCQLMSSIGKHPIISLMYSSLGIKNISKHLTEQLEQKILIINQPAINALKHL